MALMSWLILIFGTYIVASQQIYDSSSRSYFDLSTNCNSNQGPSYNPNNYGFYLPYPTASSYQKCSIPNGQLESDDAIGLTNMSSLVGISFYVKFICQECPVSNYGYNEMVVFVASQTGNPNWNGKEVGLRFQLDSNKIYGYFQDPNGGSQYTIGGMNNPSYTNNFTIWFSSSYGWQWACFCYEYDNYFMWFIDGNKLWTTHDYSSANFLSTTYRIVLTTHRWSSTFTTSGNDELEVFDIKVINYPSGP